MELIKNILEQMYPEARYLSDKDYERLYANWLETKEDLKDTIFGGKNKVSFNISYKLSKEEIYDTYINFVGYYCNSAFHKLLRLLEKKGYDVADVISCNIMPLSFDYSKVKYQKGMKITKVFKKIITQHWNKEIAELSVQKYSNVIQNTNLNETVFISTLPEDILTMSYNTNGWSSCMSPTSDTTYKFGMLEYLESGGIAIAYTKSSMDLKDGVDNKKWRSLIEFNTRGNYIQVSIQKSYPTKRDKAVLAIQHFLTELNGGVEDESFYVEPPDYKFAYRDASALEFKLNNNVPYDLSSNGDYYCPFCDAEEKCSCMSSDNLVECDFCGRIEENEEMRHVFGNTVCETCFDDYFFVCDNCGEVFERDDLISDGPYDYCPDCYAELDNE